MVNPPKNEENGYLVGYVGGMQRVKECKCI